MRMEPPEERLIELDARSYSEYEESDSIANFTIFSTAQPPIITTEITSFRQAAFSISAAEREPAHVLPLHSPPPHADSPARNDDASAGTTYTLAKASTTNVQLSRFVAPHVGATPSQPGSREGSWTFSRQPECTPRTGLPITYLTDRLFVQYRSFAVPSSCSMECRGPVHQYFNKQSMEPTAQPDGPTQLPP